MQFSGSKTAKGAFTYYVITGGGGGGGFVKCLCMILGEGEGGWPCDDRRKYVFYKVK